MKATSLGIGNMCFHTQVREHENQILSPSPFSLRYHPLEAHVQYMQKKKFARLSLKSMFFPAGYKQHQVVTTASFTHLSYRIKITMQPRM